MDYFPRKSLSKNLTDMTDFNKHVHDINIFINDKWRKYDKNQFVDRKFSISYFMQWSSPYLCIAWSLDPVFNTWQPEPIMQFK
jgi:hypothetical protein